ncbi:MAG: TlyA family rRNA (cytidine-2'-O)-methyltransferase, partial [Firmicutes bacterium]|nr:TlyA family rRNA (cytidine-2'-O)-methyltransferase [Bacillota bacterium]
MRLDLYLFEKGYAESRERAKFLILEGSVSVNGRTAQKPSFEIDEGREYEITVKKDSCPY